MIDGEPRTTRVLLGEFGASAMLTLMVFLSGTGLVQVGVGSAGTALLGSVILGFGVGLIIWTFGPLSGAQGSPLVTLVATALGRQRVATTFVRIVAQVIGMGLVVLALSPMWPNLTAGPSYRSVDPLADGVAAFGFMVVALGVANRRSVRVPVALGAFATASFWMTGRATLGNPLLSFAVLCLTTPQDVTASSVAEGIAGAVGGAAVGAVVALFLFPHTRESAAVLLFCPVETTARRSG